VLGFSDWKMHVFSKSFRKTCLWIKKCALPTGGKAGLFRRMHVFLASFEGHTIGCPNLAFYSCQGRILEKTNVYLKSLKETRFWMTKSAPPTVGTILLVQNACLAIQSEACLSKTF
jgi:hypothetical protein